MKKKYLISLLVIPLLFIATSVKAVNDYITIGGNSYKLKKINYDNGDFLGYKNFDSKLLIFDTRAIDGSHAATLEDFISHINDYPENLTQENKVTEQNYGVAGIIKGFNATTKTEEDYYFASIALMYYLNGANGTHIATVNDYLTLAYKFESYYENITTYSKTSVNFTYDEKNQRYKSEQFNATNSDVNRNITWKGYVTVYNKTTGKYYNDNGYAVGDDELKNIQIGICDDKNFFTESDGEQYCGGNTVKKLEPGDYEITVKTKKNLQYAPKYSGAGNVSNSEFNTSWVLNAYGLTLVTPTNDIEEGNEITGTFTITDDDVTAKNVEYDIEILDQNDKNLKGIVNIYEATTDGKCTDTLIKSANITKGRTSVYFKQVSSFCAVVESLDEYKSFEQKNKLFLSATKSTYTIKVDTTASTAKETLKVKFYNNKTKESIVGVKYEVYSDYNEKNKKCSGDELATGLSSVNGYNEIKLDSLPQEVCINVTDINEIYSEQKPQRYEVSSGILSIPVELKVTTGDTMANVSIIIISAGALLLILGGYLLYMYKLKKEDLTEMEK